MKLILSYLYLSILSLAHTACVPPGNVFPFPTYNLDAELSAISQNLTDVLDGLNYDPSIFEGSTFSVELTTANSTFFEYHHKGPLSENSTQEINGDSIYRIASNTKVFIALLLLRAREQGKVNVDDPITKYIPELEGDDTEVPWNQVTLRSTVAHLSGTVREGAIFDLLWSIPGIDPTLLGLPPMPPTDDFACNSIPGSPDCSDKHVINYARNTDRAYHVWDRPTYSNIGIGLLGVALARVYNTTVNQLFEDEAFTPANMTSSSMTPPEENGVIPDIPNDWELDFGESGALGAQFSSSHDIMNFHRSLFKGEILSRPVVNEWLKPVSYSGPLFHAYGAPWEIFNFDQFTSSNRTVNMYTKFGTLAGL